MPVLLPLAAFIIDDIIVWAIVLAAVAGGAYAATALGQQRPKTRFDRTPTVLTKRGSVIPRLIGRHTVPVNVGWSGKRRKGDRYYHETVWCRVCVGPADVVYKIKLAEKDLWVGPIYRATTPSGTYIPINRMGTRGFWWYWGESDQPVDPLLSDTSVGPNGKNRFVGIASRWPFCCYMILDGVRMIGDPPSLPQIRVDVEVRPQPHADPLTSSPSYILPSAAGRGDEGPNPAHAVWELLTLPHPHGIGVAAALVDKAGFEELGIIAAADRQPAHLASEQGEEAQVLAVLKPLKQELDFFLNTVAGRLRPYAIRAPAVGASLPVIVADATDQATPEERRVQGEFAPDRLSFRINDQSLEFEPYALTLPDDSTAWGRRRPNSRQVNVETVTNRRVLWAVAFRMQPKLLNNAQPLNFKGGREVRLMHPGQPFLTAGGQLARLLSLEPTVNEPAVRVEGTYEFYSTPTPAYVDPAADNSGGSTPDRGDPDVDPYVRAFPVGYDYAPQLAPPNDPDLSDPAAGGTYFAVIRARAHGDIVEANVHLSRGGNSYSKIGEQNGWAAGHTIDSALPGTSTTITTGPVVTPFAHDDTENVMLDLTASEEGWLAGEQLWLVDDELMIVRNVVSAGGGKWRLDGIGRAQFGTAAAAHAIGAKGLLFRKGDAHPQQPVLELGRTYYVKTEPKTDDGRAVTLGQVPPTTISV